MTTVTPARISAGSWATWSEKWPAPVDGPLFPPSSPEWLTRAPRWELDPLAPALGPAAPGGWVWSPRDGGGPDGEVERGEESSLPGEPSAEHGETGGGSQSLPWVGLFQLTDVESFWVLSTPDRLDQVVALCERLSSTHSAFTWLTGYFDAQDILGSLRLPMECAPELEFALTEGGYAVDVWW